MHELPLPKAMKGHSSDNITLRLHKLPTNEELFLNVSARPLISRQGKQKGAVLVARDFSAMKKTQDELESFIYTVSHDLRSPLSAIMGFTQIILDEHNDGLNQTAQLHLSRIINATKRMRLVIDGLLEFSQLSRTELAREKVNLSFFARDIATELQQLDTGRKAKFVIEDNIVITGDMHLLTIALTNLMQNAYKFTERQPETVIEFGKTKINENETYFLRDNGAGFDMRHVDKLFKPFERLHGTNEFPGTGTGLATVHRIIQRHGGKIWAEAEVDKGATFYFTL
jgi:light-regulated signal transduction histidine kinase (bacteriophytochrome)